MLSPLHFFSALLAMTSSTLAGPIVADHQNNSASNLKIESVLVTEHSWDGVKLAPYPQSQPELSVIKLYIPPNTTLDWHIHSAPNAGYLLDGTLTLENKLSGEKIVAHAGGALAETLNVAHRGFTGESGATLIVFYAGTKGLPLSTPAK